MKILLSTVLLLVGYSSFGEDCPRGIYPPQRFEHIEVVTVCGEGSDKTKKEAREKAYTQTNLEFKRVYSDRYINQQVKKVVGDERCTYKEGSYKCAMFIDYQINLSLKKDNYISESIAQQILDNQKTFNKETQENFKVMNNKIDTELERVSLEKIELNKKVKELNKAITLNEKLKNTAKGLEEKKKIISLRLYDDKIKHIEEGMTFKEVSYFLGKITVYKRYKYQECAWDNNCNTNYGSFQINWITTSLGLVVDSIWDPFVSGSVKKISENTLAKLRDKQDRVMQELSYVKSNPKEKTPSEECSFLRKTGGLKKGVTLEQCIYLLSKT